MVLNKLMRLKLKKIFYIISFNVSLFLMLMIGIQNSSKESKVNLILNETIKLPISFIIGLSFISGSIFSNLLSINFDKTNNQIK